MAVIEGNLWDINFARLIVLDVSSDYELMRDPMPPICYPVLTEKWVHRSRLPQTFAHDDLISGYLYDWHEPTEEGSDALYVGVVRSELAATLLGSRAH